MKHRVLFLLLVLLISAAFPLSASAVTIKPVGDPWDDPELRENDGGTYYAAGSAGYVVLWETPECSVDGKYKLLSNGTKLKVEYRISYLEDVPWGLAILNPKSSSDAKSYDGWVLMTDLVKLDGTPAYVAPQPVPPHPMIENPQPVSPPAVTPEPTPEPTPQIRQPQRPQQAITINNTYNAAIVYTSIGIAVFALLLVLYVLLKHKAVNKKGE